MRLLNIYLLILFLALPNLLKAKGQEAGNETLDPITKRPTSISIEYCTELLDFDEFIQKYIGGDFDQYMTYVEQISRRFYIERKSAAKNTEVCVTDLRIEEIILELPATSRERVAGWKTKFSGIKNRLAIKRSYVEDQAVPAIEKVATVFKELLHKEFDESSDPYWQIRKNEVAKAIFDSFTTNSPSQEKVLEMILERKMISEPKAMWVINGCRDNELMCPYLFREYKSYYKLFYGGHWEIRRFFGQYQTFTIYSATSCQDSADLCKQAYDILHELWLALGEKESKFFEEAYDFSSYLISLALASTDEQEKKKYYDLYLWIKSQGNYKHLEVRLAEDYDLGDETGKIEYRKRRDYRVWSNEYYLEVSAGKSFKNGLEVLDELLGYSVINVDDVITFFPAPASFMALSLDEKKHRYLNQKIWSKTEDILVNASLENFPKNRTEIKRLTGFDNVLFIAFLVEQGEVTKNLKVPNSKYRIKDVFKRYKQTKKAYDILNSK
ncbi:MAG: hypothetical protein VX642_05120 [Bdellovibrionota bacterium]|nr:hypothetical protein [Bdellovibrionota bacterium]